MDYKKVGKHLSKIDKKNKKKLNDNSFQDHHKRLIMFKIEHFKEDLQELERLHSTFLTSRSEKNFEHLVSMIYFVIEEDIQKNFSFQFLHEKHTKKNLEELFSEVKKLVNSLDEIKKTNWTENIYLILKSKTEVINTEIKILHSEKKSIKKIRENSHLKNDEGMNLLKIHTTIWQHFKQLNELINQKYYELKSKKNLYPNKLDLTQV